MIPATYLYKQFHREFPRQNQHEVEQAIDDIQNSFLSRRFDPIAENTGNGLTLPEAEGSNANSEEQNNQAEPEEKEDENPGQRENPMQETHEDRTSPQPENEMRRTTNLYL
ncbi:hypothetical protein EOD39_11065 [Acipenser ruthenus]|uniref:Uncharacterized protein n=1 Tax=Acipenser ruthenus TaxID=7906 RepID=A0A444UPZ9_ACIRT|nr:hypothetical protein EOD39_11065 [Acipenser ruthenus]